MTKTFADFQKAYRSNYSVRTFWFAVPEHSEQEFNAACALFAVTREAWFPVPGKLAISREEATGQTYDANQGGWAWL